MVHRMLLWIITSCCVSANLNALIAESKAFRDILTYVNTNNTTETLVLADLDNTVEEPLQELGSDQWFFSMVNEKTKTGLTIIQAIDQVVPIYRKVHAIINLKPVEPDIPNLIKMLQLQGIKIVGYTARSLPIEQRTLEQLAGISITFTSPHVWQEQCDLYLDFPAHYANGIIFCGNNNKGKLLIHFFKTLNYWPKKVIFIDDKLNNLLSVEAALNEYGIEFIGLRYGYLDEKVKNFNSSAAQEQLRNLHVQ